jgi:hypothetical protein
MVDTPRAPLSVPLTDWLLREQDVVPEAYWSRRTWCQRPIGAARPSHAHPLVGPRLVRLVGGAGRGARGLLEPRDQATLTHWWDRARSVSSADEL